MNLHLSSEHTSEAEPLLPSNEPRIAVDGGQLSKTHTSTLIWTLLGLWFAVFLGALDGTMVATLITPIGSHFKQSHEASYLGTSYLLSACCFSPLYGQLSDAIGRKGAMLLALVLFTTGTFFCGLAPSMGALIAARGIAGMGGGGILTVSSITVSDLIPLRRRGVYQSFTSILFGLGSGLGGPLGGWINDTIGWRWAFLIRIPFLVASMTLVTFKFNIKPPYDSQSHSVYKSLGRIDWAGSLAFVSAVGCFLLGVNLKTVEEISWTNPPVWGSLVGCGVSIVLFIIIEVWWSVVPVMPMRLFKMRTPMAVCLANFLLSTEFFMLIYNVPLYFSAVRLTKASEAGSHLIPNLVALGFGSVFTGWMIRHTGKLYYLTIGSAFLTFLTGILVSTWNEGTPAFRLWLDIVPDGFGGIGCVTATFVALVASVSREDMAIATGMTYLFRGCGQVLGVSMSGALVQAVLIHQLHEKITGPSSEEIIRRIRHDTGAIATLDPFLRKAAVDSYAAALKAVFLCQAGIAFCAFLSCLSIEENPLPNSHEEQEERDRLRREQQDL